MIAIETARLEDNLNVLCTDQAAEEIRPVFSLKEGGQIIIGFDTVFHILTCLIAAYLSADGEDMITLRFQVRKYVEIKLVRTADLCPWDNAQN